jgi:hypothetical protein
MTLKVFQFREEIVEWYSDNYGGLLTDSVNTFLKLKQEASTCPARVKTESNQDKYTEEYKAAEGMVLDDENIATNSQERTLTKLKLNSV